MMASLQGVLRDVLAADPAVTALLGAGDDCRVYPLDAPAEHARPYALYSRGSEVRYQTLAGFVALRECFLTYEIYGGDGSAYASADACAQAIKAALLPLGKASLASGAVRLEGVTDEGADDDVTAPEAQEELGVMRVTVGFRVFWNEG